MPSATDKRPPGDNRRRRTSSRTPPCWPSWAARRTSSSISSASRRRRPQPRPEGLEAEPRRRLPDGQGAGVHRQLQGLYGGDRSSKVQNGQGDGNIEGITKDGDARHGTEAGMVKDFAEKGYGARTPVTS